MVAYRLQNEAKFSQPGSHKLLKLLDLRWRKNSVKPLFPGSNPGAASSKIKGSERSSPEPFQFLSVFIRFIRLSLYHFSPALTSAELNCRQTALRRTSGFDAANLNRPNR